jgi:hypothetical protein
VKLRRRRRIYYLGAVIVLLTTGFFIVRHAVVSAHAVTASPVADTIVVNAASGATFAPAPTGASPALTAEQAWADYVKVAGGSANIPSGVNIQLGLVTWPSGSADAPGASGETIVNGVAYVALNELAYGYSEPSPCRPTFLEAPGQPSAASSSSGSCVDWLFVDANSGQQIMETWQNVG